MCPPPPIYKKPVILNTFFALQHNKVEVYRYYSVSKMSIGTTVFLR